MITVTLLTFNLILSKLENIFSLRLFSLIIFHTLTSSIFNGFDDNDHNLLTLVRRHICCNKAMHLPYFLTISASANVLLSCLEVRTDRVSTLYGQVANITQIHSC